MTTGTGTSAGQLGNAIDGGGSDVSLDHWQEVRSNGDIQFEPVEIPVPAPREPNWFDHLLEFIGSLLQPVGQALGATWPILKWGLLAIALAALAYLIWKMIDPIASLRGDAGSDTIEPEWQPDRSETIALLEDADRMAADGEYAAAIHLLLQRSVGQIAKIKPDWVSPSSTARELAVLPALSEKARAAFGTIAQRVERSLFALKSIDREDWEAARAAYAEFALAKIVSDKPMQNTDLVAADIGMSA
ncbi:MAG: hypothetical protein ABJP48_12815 [Erythrobacter sp.]